MGNATSSDESNSSDQKSAKENLATSDERRLRGADLGGSENKRAVNHDEYEKQRNTDSELRVNDEQDSLYDDGLEIEEDDSPLAGTRGPSSGIKP